ncbi:cytochrome c [Marinimicrobium sp. ABcell2]|uniref:c-type cytochrome n=1 Tax=Marinimicrobium sp. ABcell2 TaxID=3069751 RepID=UPI0027B04FB2|nr:cytochrome c [Marinimicrobium sp. ABcell2]MDQ2075345.1 cytochrome c [Marinimicrobium sp. ABcell2]
MRRERNGASAPFVFEVPTQGLPPVKIALFPSIIAVLTGMLLLLSGCGPSPAPSPGTEVGGDSEEALLLVGRQRSRTCMGCHGPQGISRVRSYPSLAGQSKEYLQEQMLAYRSGERDDPMMSSIARNLSDEDIVALSHYYASLPGPEERN